MNRRLAASAALCGLVGLGLACNANRGPSTPDRVASVLRDSADTAGFAKVLAPRDFDFPRDHAAHPGFRHEWWYVTGHLADARHQRLGFQLTFFRYGLAPADSPSSSRWRSRQALLAHLALTDESGQRFETHVRQAREGLGLAGADPAAARVWIKDWSLVLAPNGQDWRLLATAGDLALDLTLHPTKPIALQGDAGFSQKSATAGNASYYYSLPRLVAAGSLRRRNASGRVQGSAWLDHEWGSSGLGADQQGWDWFALQLDDGRELSFYRLRQADGRADPKSRGIVVAAAGTSRPLPPGDITMTPERYWRSPATGIRYPVGWRVSVPGEALDLRLDAVLDPQEWTGSLRYWEGAVRVVDARDPARQLGRGYLELTGYTR